jgi:hypothetical protein
MEALLAQRKSFGIVSIRIRKTPSNGQAFFIRRDQCEASSEKQSHPKKPCTCLSGIKKRGVLNLERKLSVEEYPDCEGCVPLTFKRALFNPALWVEKDQLFQETTSVLTT